MIKKAYEFFKTNGFHIDTLIETISFYDDHGLRKTKPTARTIVCTKGNVKVTIEDRY